MYSSFRKKFLEKNNLKLSEKSVRHALKSPDGDELFTDYLYTPEKKKKVFVHISGLHGVEGYIGSDIQSQILENLKDPHELSFQLVLIHAANPYGMAWFHRTNANNVDLNRNGLKSFALSNPHFAAFKKVLTATNPIDRGFEFLKVLPFILKIGIRETIKTVASGQADFPDAPFFTGHEIQAELLSLVSILKEITAPDAELYFLDVHSGLGKFGGELLIIESGGDSQATTFFERAFQQKVFDPAKQKNAYPAHGSLSSFLKLNWQERQIFYVLQEFGTRSVTSVLKALGLQNQFITGGAEQRSPSHLTHLKRAMLHNFYPSEKNWKEICLENGVLRFEQMKKNLNKT